MKNITSLNEEAEQLIGKIERMIVEEDKVGNMNNADIHYYREVGSLRRSSREILEQDCNNYNQT